MDTTEGKAARGNSLHLGSTPSISTMNRYTIEVDTRGYELYEVWADSEGEAREIYNDRAHSMEPYQSEIIDSEIVRIKED